MVYFSFFLSFFGWGGGLLIGPRDCDFLQGLLKLNLNFLKPHRNWNYVGTKATAETEAGVVEAGAELSIIEKLAI